MITCRMCGVQFYERNNPSDFCTPICEEEARIETEAGKEEEEEIENRIENEEDKEWGK